MHCGWYSKHALTCVLCRFYLPECWKVPVSIEGRDMQPWTLHAPRKHPSIAGWQFVQVGAPACMWMGKTLHTPARRLRPKAVVAHAVTDCSTAAARTDTVRSQQCSLATQLTPFSHLQQGVCICAASRSLPFTYSATCCATRLRVCRASSGGN